MYSIISFDNLDFKVYSKFIKGSIGTYFTPGHEDEYEIYKVTYKGMEVPFDMCVDMGMIEFFKEELLNN